VIAFLAVAAVLGRCGSSPNAGSSERSRVIATVQTYLKARDGGDARAACAAMNVGQRFEMVARVTQNYATASAGACERHVLAGSSLSSATTPARDVLLDATLDLEFLGSGAWRAASVRRRDRPGPQMELILEAGRWKVDGSAFEKVSFVTLDRYRPPRRWRWVCLTRARVLKHDRRSD